MKTRKEEEKDARNAEGNNELNGRSREEAEDGSWCGAHFGYFMMILMMIADEDLLRAGPKR
jgi:hypothetical protein